MKTPQNLKILNIIRQTLIVLVLLLAAAVAGFFVWSADKYVVPIMMLHSVDYESNHREKSANVLRPEYFREYLEFLREKKYNVISVPELVEGISSGKRFPRNTVVITLDDGYIDNYVHAFPLLKEHGIPAAFFLSSDLIGTEGFMNWEQVRELQRAGMTIGSHGVKHAYLPDVDRERRHAEIFNSKKALEEKLGVPIEYLSYPVGGFDEEVKVMVKNAGYKAAFTTNRGYDKFNKDLYELKRIRFATYKPRMNTFRAQISGYYNLFRRSRAPF